MSIRIYALGIWLLFGPPKKYSRYDRPVDNKEGK
jgi:hypothetical protein